MFVGNLSFDTKQIDLESLFTEVGDVIEVFMPADRETGRPRGFAFVQFAEAGSVSEAIEKFDGYELDGRNLRVNEAEERQPRPSSPRVADDGPYGGPRGGGGGSARRPKPKGSRRGLRGKKRDF